MSSLPVLAAGKFVDPKEEWAVLSHIGSGSFGAVYHVKNAITGKDAAAKLTHKYDDLRAELEVYEEIDNKSIYLPKLCAWGNTALPHFLIISLEGKTLDDIQSTFEDNVMPARDVMGYAIDSLKALQSLHSFHFVHRDLKGDNIALGLSEGRARIVLLDLGLCKRVYIKDGRRKYPKPDDTRRYLMHFASLRVMNKRSFREQDDIFALLYTMLDCRNAVKFEDTFTELMQQKEKLHNDPESVLSLDNRFYCPFIRAVASMSYSTLPDYQALVVAIQAMEPLIEDDENMIWI